MKLINQTGLTMMNTLEDLWSTSSGMQLMVIKYISTYYIILQNSICYTHVSKSNPSSAALKSNTKEDLNPQKME